MARRPLKYDFLLGGKGYLLAKQQGVRSWHRQSLPDTPPKANSRDEAQAEYGGVDPQLDYPEVWDDWSGGYGYAYRDSDHRNTYHWSENMDARFPRQLVHCQRPLTPDDPNSFFVGVDGLIDGGTVWTTLGNSETIYASGINGLMEYHLQSTGTVVCGGIDATFGNLYPAAVFGSWVYFGNSTGTFFTQTDLWLEISTRASLSGFRFAVAGNQLWKVGGPDYDHAYYLQNCGNTAGVCSPANWGATYVVGASRYPIKSLAAYDDQIFAGTPAGLFAGDASGTFVNVLSALGGQVHPDNCRDLTIFEDKVVTQHQAGVFGYRPATGQIEDMSPPRSDRSPISGVIRSVKAYGRYLYAGLYTGSKSRLLAAERGPDGALNWHTLHQMPDVQKVSRLHVDGWSTYSVFQVASDFWVTSEGSHAKSGVLGSGMTYFWRIPTLDGNPLMPSPGFVPNYVGSARIDFGSTDWGAPGTNKVYRAVELWSENLASGAQWADVYYTIDEGTRKKLGTIAKSPKDTLFFSSGEGSFVTGQAIRVSLESFTASAGVTPVYRSVVLRGALRPRYVDEITAVVRIADDMTDRQGQPMRSAQQMIGELRDLGNPDRTGLQAHELVDLAGATWLVNVLGPPEEQEVWVGRGDEAVPEVAATLRLAILSYTSA